MNKVILMGRLTRDPEVRYTTTQSGDQTCVARYSLAVDRKFARKNSGEDTTADFFNCTSFGKQGEFVEKYLKQGTKVVVVGRIENDNYTNKNGEKVYSVRIVVEEIEFAESKSAQANNSGNGGGYQPQAQTTPQSAPEDSFMAIPDGLENDLPFK